MQGIVINGVPTQHVHALDRGLHYGDGVFETIACVDAKLQFWDAHIERMKAGARKLNIQFPDEVHWLNEIAALVAASTAGRGVVKLLLTRGQSQRGYRYEQNNPPTRITLLSDWPATSNNRFDQGARLTVCEQRLSMNAQLAGIKHLNRLDNVLARNEWRDEYDEGLMLDADNQVIEGTMSNIFAVKDSTLLTPAIDRCGIAGVIRENILSIADEHEIKTDIGPIQLHDLHGMDEIFMTNSIIGLWPVAQLEDRQFSAGELTNLFNQQLQQRMDTHVKTIA